jgi:hypothetical protein
VTFTTMRALAAARSAQRRPLPVGFSLLAAATASLALWGGLFWLASQAF